MSTPPTFSIPFPRLICVTNTDRPFGPGLSTQVKARDAVLGHAIPNFYFHVSTAYGILRSQGVPLGKKDWIREWFAPNVIPSA